MSTDRTDPMAAHRAAQQLRDVVGPLYVDKVVDQFAVHFERRVNEHGVAVRRVVMYGPEEVDPNPPADSPRAEIDQLRSLLTKVRDHVGEHGNGEIDVWSLRELLAGRDHDAKSVPGCPNCAPGYDCAHAVYVPA